VELPGLGGKRQIVARQHRRDAVQAQHRLRTLGIPMHNRFGTLQLDGGDPQTKAGALRIDLQMFRPHTKDRRSAAQILALVLVLEDEVQAVLSGGKTPAEALAAAQTKAEEIMRPYVEQTALKLMN